MIGIIVGTRPEIIKMSPIIKVCEERKINFILIHTGQHYSYNMDEIFFEDLGLPEPKYKLEIIKKCKTHGEQTGEMLKEIEKILLVERPELVLVEGDTNTVLAGALSAVKLHIPVGHVEAGLRSFDNSMPEETNRILTDHCSEYLFAPTSISKNNLLNEGIEVEKIFVTGNTIVDAIYQNMEIAKKKSKVMNDLDVEPQEYSLVTVHRQENVDVEERFNGIVTALHEIKYPILYPIHPRAKKMAEKFGLFEKLNDSNHVKLIEPVGYLDFLILMKNARLVLTDSGGLQEEACILNTPCLTLRDNTERPETMEIGANYLVGTDSKKIIKLCERVLSDKILERSMRNTSNPFGDGKASINIINCIYNHE